MKRYLLGWYSRKKHTIDIPPQRKWWHYLLNVDPKPTRETQITESWDWTETDVCLTEEELQVFIREMKVENSIVRQIMAGGYGKKIAHPYLASNPLPGAEKYYPIDLKEEV